MNSQEYRQSVEQLYRDVCRQANKYFLDEVIEAGRKDWEKWQENQANAFACWFDPRQCNADILSIKLPPLAELIVLFREVCPVDECGYISVYRETPHYWFKFAFKEQDSLRDRILSWESFKTYVNSFPASYVLGSGAKPGKSAIIRYLARQTGKDQRFIHITPKINHVALPSTDGRRENAWYATDKPYGISVIALADVINPASHMPYCKSSWLVKAGEVQQLIDDIEREGECTAEIRHHIVSTIEDRQA